MYIKTKNQNTMESIRCSGCNVSRSAASFEVFQGVARKTCLCCKAKRARAQTKKNENKISCGKKMSKPNAWIQHIKAFALENKMPFGCAMSQPECRATYKTKSEKVTLGRASAFESLSSIAKSAKVNQKRTSAFESLSSIVGKAKTVHMEKAHAVMQAEQAEVRRKESLQARSAKSKATRERNRLAAKAQELPHETKPVQAKPMPQPIPKREHFTDADMDVISRIMEAYGIDSSVPSKKRTIVFWELHTASVRAIQRYGVDDKAKGQSDMEYAVAALIDPESIINRAMKELTVLAKK